MAAKDQTTAVAPISAYEKALIFGEVSALSEPDRIQYLKELAASVGLNPISRPFGYLPVRGSITVYLTATGAAQLRRIHNISITEIVDEGIVDGFYRCKVYGRMPNGRIDIEFGSVSVMGREGQHSGSELENDRKKSVTQAKTRLTKSMVGLSGVISEEEIEDIPGAGQPEEVRQLPARNGTAAPTLDPALVAEGAELVTWLQGNGYEYSAGAVDTPDALLMQVRVLRQLKQRYPAMDKARFDLGLPQTVPPAACTVDELMQWFRDQSALIAAAKAQQPQPVAASGGHKTLQDDLNDGDADLPF